MGIQQRITTSLGFLALASLLPLTAVTLAVSNHNAIAAGVFGTLFGIFLGTIIGLGSLLHFVLQTYPPSTPVELDSA